MFATKIGMKKTLVLGLLVQGSAGIMSGLSHSYMELAIFRVISGIGGSVFVAMTAAAMVVWFREKEVTFALGVTGGAAFSAGPRLPSMSGCTCNASIGLAHLDWSWPESSSCSSPWSPLPPFGSLKAATRSVA